MTFAPSSSPPWLQHTLRALDEHWWLRHGAFWLVETSWSTWFLIFQLRMTNHWFDTLHSAAVLLPLRLVLVYSLLYGVLPRLWLDAGRGRFLVLLGAWFWLGLALNFAYRAGVLLPSHRGVPSSFADYNVVFSTGSYMPLLFTAGLAACLRLYRQWRYKELANARRQQENARVELQLLRAQVHPHFLFNTLNSLYALTLRQSEEAPAVVARLTGLLRFVLEQGSAPLVPLPDEVALLRNYVALQRLRYGPRLHLEFAAPALPASARIAPLLLLPLVENAFKHGSAEQVGAARISIRLAVSGSRLSCVIENTKSPDAAPAAGPAGIGLRNVRQRLALLYPQRHGLHIDASPHLFRVQLWLELAAAEPTPAETEAPTTDTAPAHPQPARPWAALPAP